MGETTGLLFRYLDYDLQDEHFRGNSSTAWLDLYANVFFQQTQPVRAWLRGPQPRRQPAVSTNPCRRTLCTTDDLRLRSTSSALATGILLPPDLLALDSQVGPRTA